MTSIETTNKEYWMKIRHPYSCGIELTPFCNMHCVHCYMQDYSVDQLLRYGDIVKILDILFDQGVLFVYFTGGEILTHPDFLKIYLYAKKKGFIVELLTNITLLTPDILETFVAYPPATISISIYGGCEETYERMTQTKGNFSRAMASLDLLAKAGLHFEIKFIGVRENFQDFHKVEQIARKYQVKFSHTFEIFPTLNKDTLPTDHMLSSQEIVDFESSYPETTQRWSSQSIPSSPIRNAPLFFCDIATSSFIVDCEGYMNPCNKLRPQKHKILETPFLQIWEEFAAYKKTSAPPGYACASCDKRGVCVPCPAENYLSTGSYTTPSPQMCSLAQQRMETFSDSQYDCFRK